jgi:SAM-dependent methyltransferase
LVILPEHFLPVHIVRFVLSSPAESLYKRITGISIGNGIKLEKLTDTQCFTENIKTETLYNYLDNALSFEFKNLTAWDGEYEYSVRISKKGKVFTGRKNSNYGNNDNQKLPHNNEKHYIFKDGNFAPPLYDMGLQTEDGKIKAAMFDKFRQLNRFIEIIDDVISKIPPDKTNSKPLKIVDFGCGKSYLTFAVYYYLTEIKKRTVFMTGLDLKEDVINKCNAAAKKYGYDNLQFLCGDIASSNLGDFDMMITLHACDTATDHALFYAITHGVKYIFSVPCCQKEINAQIRPESFPLMLSHGLTKERFSALLTDSIRSGLLTANGYSVDLMEFVNIDSTPKNLLIRAKKAHINEKKSAFALAEINKTLEFFHINQTLYNLLYGDEK